jgi:hypothetical protein
MIVGQFRLPAKQILSGPQEKLLPLSITPANARLQPAESIQRRLLAVPSRLWFLTTGTPEIYTQVFAL